MGGPRGCGGPEDFCDVTEAEGALNAARREFPEETGWVLGSTKLRRQWGSTDGHFEFGSSARRV
jgi:8-oxo-dGTP pyrophosphatase MutT (NUDIX family)